MNLVSWLISFSLIGIKLHCFELSDSLKSRAVQSPAKKYHQKLETGEFLQDAAQAQVVCLFEDLYQRLQNRPRKPQGLSKWWSRLGRKEPEKPIEGLYIWGGVGRGKTMLMDLFYDTLPPQTRLRMHFHRFMRRVHDGLTRWSGTANPLRKVAEEFAQETQVLCFDEFFVADIGDAMILAEVMAELFGLGVTLVATSNVEPKRLYENGLQRRRFLPAIDLLYEHTSVHAIAAGVDFRLRTLEQAQIYHWPLDAAAEQSLSHSFKALAPEQPQIEVMLNIEGRDIRARQVADDVVWFDFTDLCEGPRSQNDYIELAMIYHAVVLSNVPRLTTKNEDAARRFISLVDEFYDHGVKLIISAAEPILSIYQGERLRFEFERTQSRLLEMQSHEYLSRSHQAASHPLQQA
ncbi:MAG: cell division protein ZapE [Gammaproteobacteria bacterium]|nr:cell division protein ZapE [Gammaproteobacteria bacterium]